VHPPPRVGAGGRRRDFSRRARHAGYGSIGVRVPVAIVLVWLLGCRSDRPEDPRPAAPESSAAPVGPSMDGLPAWGPAPPLVAPEWVGSALARDALDPALAGGLADGDTRPAAAWTLARIGGAQARDWMLEALRNEEGESQEAWVGAIAFLEPPALEPGAAPEPVGPWAELEDALWIRYASTDDDGMAQGLLLAAARVGGKASQVRLAADTEILPHRGREARYRSAMEAMGILCARGHGLSRTNLRSIVLGLSADAHGVQAAAAYALGRCAAVSAEEIAGDERAALVERLEPLTLSSDPEVARLAWKAVGGIGVMPGDVDARILGPSGPPWPVEVEAVGALSGHADGREVIASRLARLPAAAIDDVRVHAVLAALQGLRDAMGGMPELMTRIDAFAAVVAGARVAAQGRAIKRFTLVDCEIAVLRTILDGEVDRVDRCAREVEGLPEWYGEALSVEALLRIGSAVEREEKVRRLLARVEDPRPQVAARALAGLADVDDDRVGPVLRTALGLGDVGVTAAAATAIAARAVDASRRDVAAVAALQQAVATLEAPSAVEARIATLEALGGLARSATRPDEVLRAAQWLEQSVLPMSADSNAAVRRAAREALLGRTELVARFDATDPPTLAVDPFVAQAWDGRGPDADGLRVVTDAGALVVDFRGAPAPVMQAVLLRLSRQEFYDGLTFHRVVPGFVVQGGDPHGDGYGGPGFIVPCERSTVRYERGTVGIALAGKDTGGSQFFIAQTRQPHLDARFPVVGRVIEGLDVLDRILPHDRIVRAEPWVAAE
jgi:cyclophilin family peptidyl-prolyl cis-trans isomerase